jgi:hypothetical protein
MWKEGHDERVAERGFDLTTTVPAPPEAVVDFLMDLDRHRGLHPFLVSADVVAQGVGETGPWWEWRVLERPRLGPVHYPIRFPARLVRTSPTSMESWVRAAPGCVLRSVTFVALAGSGCSVVERTRVTAPRPVVTYMVRQARTAHERTFRLLPGAFTGGS